jgi:fumarate hydratase subunit beta
LITREAKVIRLKTPVSENTARALRIGEQIEIEGTIYCGRDAVLPRLVDLCERNDLHRIQVDLRGSVIFHTAVSPAGIGPTTSNKVEIESSIPTLSRAGVKIHIGKGSLSPDTVAALEAYNAVFAITPPVSALFSDKILSTRVAAFREEGMEALYEIEVSGLPAIVAIAGGETIFQSPWGAEAKG